MAKWVQLFLNKGLASNGSTILNQTSLELMYTTFTIPGDGTGTTYGLGWTIGSIHPAAYPAQNKRLIFHTGDPVGGAAYISFMPDDGLGVVVLTNQHCTIPLINKWPDNIATDIYDHLINGQLTGKLTLPKRMPHAALGMTTPPPVVAAPAAAAPPMALGAYTGMFSDDGYGDFVVSRAGNSLSISYYGSSWPLQPFSDTIFAFDVPAFGMIFRVKVEYQKDQTGAISSFKAGLVARPPLDITFTKRL